MTTAPERLLRRLEWQVIRRLDGRLQGSYRTVFRGSGVDFDGLRVYTAEDDVRHIDCNVTARLDEPHVRQYLQDRELTAWLRTVDLEPGRRPEVVLAVSEAAANAAEHAYGFDGSGIVRVEVWVDDGDLEVLVSDQGTWREPRAGNERGRGRTIMQALMRDVVISAGERGTTVRMSTPVRTSTAH